MAQTGTHKLQKHITTNKNTRIKKQKNKESTNKKNTRTHMNHWNK